MMKLVIKNSEWARGSDMDTFCEPGGTKSCCLGLMALQLGCKRSYLEEPFMRLDKVVGCPISHTHPFAIINDDETIDDETRVTQLRRLFESYDIELDWRPNE